MAVITYSLDKAPGIGNPSGGEIRPIIPKVTKGVRPSSTGRYDNKIIINNLKTEKSQRNPLLKGVTDDYNQYDFREFLQAEDVDGYMATSFRLTIEQSLKQGYSLTGPDAELVSALTKQIRAICKASSTTLYTVVENLITGLTKFNNAFLIITRKEMPGSKFKSYKFRGRTVNPISGFFYTEPQYMKPELKNGRIVKWIYNNPDIGAGEVEFHPDDVLHMFWNKKGSDVFGTPWMLPALDDIRMLRRLEEFAQMLISKHLFPIFQYKVGTKDNPTVEFQGGTSEVQMVQSQVGDLPQQGCIFTSHRHEIIAIDTKGSLDIEGYITHFDNRALSSCGLSAVDIGRGDTSNKGTAQVMNQSRVDRCTRIQRVMSEYFNDVIIFSLLMELGLDPFDEETDVELTFHPVDTEERRAQEQHNLQMFQSDGITHPEFRKSLGKKAFQHDQEWELTHSNTTKRMQEQFGNEANIELEKKKAVTKQVTSPANKSNPSGKTKPRVSKNS